MVANNFSTFTPTLTGENYHIWAIKIKVYLKGLGLLRLLRMMLILLLFHQIQH